MKKEDTVNNTPNTNKPDEKRAIEKIAEYKAIIQNGIYQSHDDSFHVTEHAITTVLEDYHKGIQSQLHAKSEECERLRKRVAELEHIIDHEINDDEDNFQYCADCDLPDACSDYGCAIENGIKRKNDGVF